MRRNRALDASHGNRVHADTRRHRSFFLSSLFFFPFFFFIPSSLPSFLRYQIDIVVDSFLSSRSCLLLSFLFLVLFFTTSFRFYQIDIIVIFPSFVSISAFLSSFPFCYSSLSDIIATLPNWHHRHFSFLSFCSRLPLSFFFLVLSSTSFRYHRDLSFLFLFLFFCQTFRHYQIDIVVVIVPSFPPCFFFLPFFSFFSLRHHFNVTRLSD